MLGVVFYYRTRPLRPLVFVPKAQKGRSSGRCVVKTQRGPTSRQLSHLINYVPHLLCDYAQLVRVEQGRFRSGPVGLFRFLRSGFLSYLVVPSGMAIGDSMLLNFSTAIPAVSSESGSVANGFLNSFSVKPLAFFSRGSVVHCVEISPFGGFKLCRSAGCSAVIEAISSGVNLVKVLLPSGKYSFLHGSAYAVSGSVGNKQHKLTKYRIAGQSFWLGKRPVTRGVAMNPIDHPHGGGEGKTSGGRPSVSASGVLAKGYRTLSYKRRCRAAALKQRFVLS